MTYKDICVYKREPGIKGLNMDGYRLNPIVTYEWEWNVPIGRAENLHWEGNDLVCDLHLNHAVDMNVLFPMIGYLLKDAQAQLLVINLSVRRNIDLGIKCLGDQINGSKILINGKALDYGVQKMEELVKKIDEMSDEEFYRRIDRYLKDESNI